jgi:shikimate 5-dehydrogenase
MSVARINEVLHLIGRIPEKKMFIIGHNISHLLSFTIHNASFAELGYRITTPSTKLRRLINR